MPPCRFVPREILGPMTADRFAWRDNAALSQYVNPAQTNPYAG